MSSRSKTHGTCVGAFVLALSAVAGAQTTPPAGEKPPTDSPQPAASPKPEAPKPASLTLTAGDSSVKLGGLLQAQADWAQDSTGYAQNLGLRRARFNLAGNATKNVYFFWQVENARLGFASTTSAGVTTKAIASGFQTLDAVVEWRIDKKFNLWGGLIYIPTSRDALKSSATQFFFDQGTWAYTATGALGGTGGRDTGFQARGYLGDRFEYRLGVFSGLRKPLAHNSYRYVGRVQYNFFDKEVYNLPAYAGANLGSKKILAVGGAFDAQMEYRGFTADVFADIPRPFGSIIGMAAWQSLDGDTTVTSLPKSTIVQLEAGAYLKRLKIGPAFRYEQRSFSKNSAKNEKRWSAGFSYFIKGNNAKIKVLYGRTLFEDAKVKDANQCAVILQSSL